MQCSATFVAKRPKLHDGEDDHFERDDEVLQTKPDGSDNHPSMIHVGTTNDLTATYKTF